MYSMFSPKPMVSVEFSVLFEWVSVPLIGEIVAFDGVVAFEGNDGEFPVAFDAPLGNSKGA